MGPVPTTRNVLIVEDDDVRLIVYTAHIGVARDAHVLRRGADHLVPKVTVVVEDVVGIVFAGLSRPEASAIWVAKA